METVSEIVEPDCQRTFDSVLAELREQYLNVDSQRKADLERYRGFLRTIMVNALLAPDNMTPHNVAFFCDAALKGYSVSRAIDKFRQNRGIVAIALPEASPASYAAGVAAERKRCDQAAYGQIMSGNSRLVEINNDAVRKIRAAIAAAGGE